MALKEVFARFAFAFDGQQKLTQAERGVDRIAGKAKDGEASLGGLAAGLASAFAGNALLGGLNHFAEQLDVLDDLSTQTGVATDALQVYGYAAQKSGSSVEEMNASLSLLQKSLGKTTESSGAQVDALKALKIDTSQPRQLAEVLPEIFANFGQLKTQAEKASVATSLFGRAGVRLIPTLERGQAGLAEMRAELEESGGIVSAETIARAGEYRDNLARLDRSFFALKGTVAGALFPQISKLVEVISKGVGGLSNFVKGTTLADNAAIALAGSLAGPLFGALRPFIGKGLKFAAIFGAIDDVIGFLQGKDSLIADLLNGAFGDGTADAVRDYVNDAVGQLGFLMQSHSNIMAVIEDTNSSTWQRIAAYTTLFLREIGSGFPIIRTGAALTWAGLVDDFQNAILQLEIAWNRFLASIHLPDSVTELLKFDTKDAFKRTIESGENRNEAGIKASAAVNHISEAEQARREASGNFQNIGQEALAANGGRSGIAEAGAARVGRVNQERADAIKQGEAAAPAAVQATLQQAAAQGATATLNDNKTVNLNFAKGISSADRDEIKKAVAEALRTDNRSALEALTQRAKK